ncbi:MAG: hypothetical protein RR571_08915 [Anaerorhabdus sp.]
MEMKIKYTPRQKCVRFYFRNKQRIKKIRNEFFWFIDYHPIITRIISSIVGGLLGIWLVYYLFILKI